MKKRTIITLASLSLLFACGTKAPEPTPDPIDELGIISLEEFFSYRTVEKLTLDNFYDYAEVREEEYMKKDAFGDETGLTGKDLKVVFKDNVGVIQTNNNDDAIARFSYKFDQKITYLDKETKEALPYNGPEWLDQTGENDIYLSGVFLFSGTNTIIFLVDEYESTYYDWEHAKEFECIERNEILMKECELTKIKGHVQIWNIPEEKWQTGEDGRRFIRVFAYNEEDMKKVSNAKDFYAELYEDGVILRYQKNQEGEFVLLNDPGENYRLTYGNWNVNDLEQSLNHTN